MERECSKTDISVYNCFSVHLNLLFFKIYNILMDMSEIFLYVRIKFFNFYFYFILLYNTVFVSPYIDMNPPWVYMRSQT